MLQHVQVTRAQPSVKKYFQLIVKYTIPVLRPSLECGCEVWCTNKYQDKALKPIQLRTCKYILGWSVTTCNEPVRTNLALESLECRRDFCRLNWYQKIMCMNEKRLPCKLLSNKWDNVKCKGHPNNLGLHGWVH